jgi:hypothetical protein
VKQIDTFIAKLKERYCDLNIGYDCDAETDQYNIWHTDSDLQFNNKDFLVFTGTLIVDLFYRNDIFNISFGYDYRNEYEAKFNYTPYMVIDTQVAKISYSSVIYQYDNQIQAMWYNRLGDIGFSETTTKTPLISEHGEQASVINMPLEHLGDSNEKVLAA